MAHPLASKAAHLSSRVALAAAFAISFGVPSVCALAQTAPPASPVYVNPRAGADDPRVGLKGGLYNAGEAAMGLQHVISVPKPEGFAPDEASIAAYDAAPEPPAAAPGAAGAGGRGAARAPGAPAPVRANYGGTNSDIGFQGKYLFGGNYNGINIYDISDPAKIKLVTSIVCPGGQGDVSVYKNLLFMSVEATSGRIDCGTQGIPLPAGYVPPAPPAPPVPGAPPAAARAPRQTPASPDRMLGVRIFDISDITKPKQVADVQTCRGSHTHTLLVDPKDKDNVYIYVSGSAGIRSAEELKGCSAADPKDDPDSANYTIVVIKVPVAHPELAKVVNSPRIFQDPVTGAANGLWNGGNHGEGTQTTSATRGCHDITVYSYIGLAAGACSGNGILLDIKDPVHPVRVDAVTDPNYAFWHSANFNNDGTTVVFSDEWGGGGQPRCLATDPMNWGADAIFALKDKKLTLSAYYKMPAPQTEKENCVAHNGSLIPVPGRDIHVQSWYQGGVSIMDYTDRTHPYEIAFFDRGPIDPIKRAGGGQWSTYYYNGYIYGSEMARGIDVLKLVPSKFITQNEIDAAAQVKLDVLNVQNQPHIVWPPTFITAKAYIDELARSGGLAPADVTTLMAAIDAKKISTLHTWGAKIEKSASGTVTPKDAERMKALAEILKKSSATTANNAPTSHTGNGR
jgi:hypothetical protein